MDFDAYLQDLRRAPFYKGQIAHVEQIPARPARFGALERPLNPLLARKLGALGLDHLYSHQADAVNAARYGEHVTVVTATASGKTLCYNLPVLDAILEDGAARAIYLFPTKALAQDQLGKLSDFGLFPSVHVATYDGDTPAADRSFVKRRAHIILTNPDMLHVGILPYHTSWSAFLGNLKYVVIDEMHSYRGVFGAHVAHIVRRLRRLCAQYGSDPRFLCCSATIANPDELTERLTGAERAIVVNENGAPCGPRTFVFWNPPVIDADQGRRRSVNIEAASLFTDLVRNGVRNITFTKARKSAELIFRYAREEFEQGEHALAGRILSYRAGYTPEERRLIERRLFRGDLLGVTATTALELGVDVGGLDATVLAGYPGTIASTWQQAGRAGRSSEGSLSLLIAYENPLDQFLMRHPDYFFERTHERAVVDPDNRRILTQHLLCAAYEHSLTRDDLTLFGRGASSALRSLEEQAKVIYRNGKWYFAGGDYPAANVNIRSASETTFRIVDSGHGNRLVGTAESNVAYRTVHPGAVYLHMGESYLVESLELATRTASVRAADVTYYTEAMESSTIQILAVKETRSLGETEAGFGEVVVSGHVSGFRRKRLFSDAVLDVEDLELPEQTFETEAFWFTVPPAAVQALTAAGGELGGSIHAVEHAVISMMPLISTCDRGDVGGVSDPQHSDTDRPTVFVYDGYPGGVGIAEAAFATLHELLGAAYGAVTECPCAEGCPSCVQSPKCGTNNEPLDKHGAILLLELLLGLRSVDA